VLFVCVLCASAVRVGVCGVCVFRSLENQKKVIFVSQGVVGQPVQLSHDVFGIGHGPSVHLCLCSRACPYSYYWLFDPREWNRPCHAMHGNGPAAAAPAPARPVNRRCRPSPRDTTVKAPAPSCPDGHSKGARLLGGNGSSKPSIHKYRCYECDNFFTQIAPKNLEPTQPNGAAWF